MDDAIKYNITVKIGADPGVSFAVVEDGGDYSMVVTITVAELKATSVMDHIPAAMRTLRLSKSPATVVTVSIPDPDEDDVNELVGAAIILRVLAAWLQERMPLPPKPAAMPHPISVAPSEMKLPDRDWSKTKPFVCRGALTMVELVADAYERAPNKPAVDMRNPARYSRMRNQVANIARSIGVNLRDEDVISVCRLLCRRAADV